MVEGVGLEMNVDEFKDKMKSYRRWKNNVRDEERWLSDKWRELSGVGGSDYSKTPGNVNLNMMEYMKVAKLEDAEAEIKKHMERLERYRMNVQELDEVLEIIPQEIREAIVMHYVKGKTLESIGMALGYSKEGVRKRFDREISIGCYVNQINHIK